MRSSSSAYILLVKNCRNSKKMKSDLAEMLFSSFSCPLQSEELLPLKDHMEPRLLSSSWPASFFVSFGKNCWRTSVLVDHAEATLLTRP
jgi:hypothetical protein